MIKCALQLGDTFQIELEFGNVGFFRRGENWNTGGKPLKLTPHITPSPVIEPGPH